MRTATEPPADDATDLDLVRRQFIKEAGLSNVHPSTLTRWAKAGVKLSDGRHVRLAAVRVGSRLFCTRQAVRDFIAATTVGTPEPGRAAIPTPRSAGEQSRASERAEAELERLGL